MEKYAPLIFEECYVKTEKSGLTKVQNAFDLQESFALGFKLNPAKLTHSYKGVHLFVLCHGFQGNSFDMRMLKNVISIALPESVFLCSTANE